MIRIAQWIPSGLALGATLTLSACASTSLVNQWQAPEYAGHAFHARVVGVTEQAGIRRTSEDEFVTQPEAVAIDAVEVAGANGLVSTRLVSAEQKMRVTLGHHRPAAHFGFYGWFSSAWMGIYDSSTVCQYDLCTSETSLYDMSKNKVV